MEWKSIFNGPSLTLSAPRAEDALIMARWTTDDEYLRLVNTPILPVPNPWRTWSKILCLSMSLAYVG